MATKITRNIPNTSKNFRIIQSMLHINVRQTADRLGVDTATVERYNDGYGRNKIVPRSTFNRLVQDLIA